MSVLIPTRNYAHFLPAAVMSVLGQRYPNFEILISDDASSDESATVIRHLATLDPRIRWIRHDPALGMVANWNWCLHEARGDYIKFLFGDDALATPDALTRLVAALDAHPAAGVAATSRLLIDGRNAITGEWNELAAGVHAGPRLVARCLRLRRNVIGEPSTVLFRRSLAHRGFDPALRQIVDLEMWFHLLVQADLVYLPQPYCAFRRHAAQQTHVNNQLRVTDLEMLAILDRYTRHCRVRPFLPPGGWRERQLLFRQWHYLRKSGDRSATALASTAALRRRLPAASLPFCWAVHRLARPMENLTRNLRRLAIRFHRTLRPNSAPPVTPARFLALLPATGFQTEPVSSPKLVSSKEALSTFPRRFAAGLVGFGVFAALGLLPPRSSPSAPTPVPAQPAPPVIHRSAPVVREALLPPTPPPRRIRMRRPPPGFPPAFFFAPHPQPVHHAIDRWI